MGETNPRLLALLLDDLAQDLERWGMRASDLISTAVLRQREALEYVVRTQRLAAIATDHSVELEEMVEAQQARIEAVYHRGKDVAAEALSLRTQAIQYGERTTRAQSFWESELQFARAWEGRAAQRVSAAEQALAQAQAELRSAEIELDYAIRSFNACANYRDEKGRGRDCSRELARVRSAEHRVAQARLWVNKAQTELAAARAELARAQARVKCTEAAVGMANEAHSMAQDALARSTEALGLGERGVEALESARKTVNVASGCALDAKEQSEQAQIFARQATNHAEEAYMHLGTATTSEESAQRMRILANAELLTRVNHLHELNRPDGLMGSWLRS